MRKPLATRGLLQAGALLLAASIGLAVQTPIAHSQTPPPEPKPHAPARHAKAKPAAPVVLAEAVVAPQPPPVRMAQATPSAAPLPRPPVSARQTVTFELGSGKLVQLATPAANVFVADPKIAEVRPGSATTLFVFGIGVGRTTIAALDENGTAVGEIDIVVRPNATLAKDAQAMLNRVFPGTRLHVEAQPRGLIVTGEAASATEAARAVSILKGYLAENQVLEDQIGVAGPVQVTLRVRIAEVSRQVTRNLGVNWSAFGSLGRYGTFPAVQFAVNGATAAACLVTQAACNGVGLNGVVDALAQDNLARVLAEPNLTAMSGQTASFLAGGEFPIPVGQQAGQVTIEFKKYGVNLAFTPTVLSDGRINLKVAPEVSQLTTQGAVTLAAGNSSIQVPALTTRRAETTVELGSGQSFAVAGLLQDNVTQSDSGLPQLGDVPVLGALFRSDKFIRNETELVIIVTPYVAKPVDDPTALKLAGASYTPPSDFERILKLRQMGAASPASATYPASAAARLPGQAGFIMQ
jgi:pilus assembly protein CpaC